jgi:N-acetyl-gamma-glutamyl-phosphate reductase
MYKVGIVGASGFTGAELMRILAGHDSFEVAVVTGDTQAGSRVADLYPSLAAPYGELAFESYEPGMAEGLDAVFLGLPHGASQAIVPELLDSVAHVIDLSADFRLKDPRLYDTWYGAAHTRPDLLDRFAYGLPELFRSDLIDAAAIAVPGCYPTAASLALVPLLRTGTIDSAGIIVDAASGASGAGRPPKPHTTFCSVDEDFTAYGLLNHRHTPEIDQVTGATVLFTPHLAPMSRGILATCYARPTGGCDSETLLGILAESYADEPFIVVDERSPSTKATAGSNSAHLTARYDDRTGHVVILCAIDNLVKGASGQAVQCANLACGLPEATGLTTAGLFP